MNNCPKCNTHLINPCNIENNQGKVIAHAWQCPNALHQDDIGIPYLERSCKAVNMYKWVSREVVIFSKMFWYDYVPVSL